MARVGSGRGAQIVYFDSEGRQNLNSVIGVVKKSLNKREELRSLKLVIFTAEGQGPAVAFTRLKDFKPTIIAVTFPHHFSVANADGKSRYFPKMPEEIRDFFTLKKIAVLTPPRLPFDAIAEMDGHNSQMQLVTKTIAMFGSGFSLCIQAVLHACDMGFLEEGESVIVMSGDTAALVVASRSDHFLNKDKGLQIQEIFCKPKNLTISRRKPQPQITPEAKTIEGSIASETRTT
jgi:uncharacterized protein